MFQNLVYNTNVNNVSNWNFTVNNLSSGFYYIKIYDTA